MQALQIRELVQLVDRRQQQQPSKTETTVSPLVLLEAQKSIGLDLTMITEEEKISYSSFISRGKRGTEFEIAVEKFDPTLEEDLGWSPKPDFKVQEESTNNDKNTLWIGTISLPRRLNAERLRVIAKEFEIFVADNHDYIDGKFEKVRSIGNSNFLEVGRLSYFDTVDI